VSLSTGPTNAISFPLFRRVPVMTAVFFPSLYAQGEWNFLTLRSETQFLFSFALEMDCFPSPLLFSPFLRSKGNRRSLLVRHGIKGVPLLFPPFLMMPLHKGRQSPLSFPFFFFSKIINGRRRLAFFHRQRRRRVLPPSLFCAP